MYLKKGQKLSSSSNKGEPLLPCVLGCPAGIEIPAYLEKLGDEKFEEALEIILEKNPFPSITGRVCPHPCEDQCNRRKYDYSVSIKAIERFIGDYGLKKGIKVKLSKRTGKTVAIVGSGPTGLSAAYFLRKAGYRIVIFEREENPGGMLRYGIPLYRLPIGILEETISMLEKMGIEIRINMEVGKKLKLDELKRDFNVVLLALGNWKEKDVGIKGEELLISSLEFLKEVNGRGRKKLGANIAVIGGGNAAVDSARTLTKLGEKVILIYRRGKEEMSAIREEVEKAREEGIDFMFLTQVTRAIECGDKITLKCIKTMLGQVDASNRRSPIPVQGSEFEMQFDAVIKAVGETSDTSFIGERFLDNHNKIRADVSTGRIEDKLFAAGDFLLGSSTTAIEAITMGRKVAKSIDYYLKSKKVMVQASLDKGQLVAFEQLDIDTFKELGINAYKHIDKTKMPLLSLAKRIKSMEEETSSIRMEDVKREVERCFSCGYCRSCGVCVYYCPLGAIEMKEDEVQVNEDKCVECGVCLSACPTKAIYEPELDKFRLLRKTFSNPTTTHISTAVPGRGTEEIKTNEVTNRFRKGFTGVAVELGRPGTGVKFYDVEKVTKMCAEFGVNFEPANPVIALMLDLKTGEIKREFLNEKILSAIVEFTIPNEKLIPILNKLKKIAKQIETVFSIDIINRVNENNSLPIDKMLKEAKFKPYINGKTNVGLGRPLAKEE